MDKSKVIFNNPISEANYNKACKSKAKFIKKFGDDSNMSYHLQAVENPVIGSMLGVKNLQLCDTEQKDIFDEKSLIVGNIRMGFGHYRISMAIASCAKALGFTPYWFDLNSFSSTTGGKIIEYQNNLYSMGSRLSQKYSLFNKLYWEPLNSEGFRQLSYNAADQKNSELFVPLFKDIPKNIPYVATHVWPSQGAVHAGLNNVVNAIPDNWQMALHLSEGAVHTVQTPSAFLGYKTLRGMDKDNILKPMPPVSLVYTGHYIDHELVCNIEADCAKRTERLHNQKAKRYLLTVGGAGAQKDFFVGIVKQLLPYIKQDKAVLFINYGDHKNVWEEMLKDIPQLSDMAETHFDNFEQTKEFADTALNEDVFGIHAFCHSDIFAAVYSTNLLMRATDVLITKPSELAFYPVPKLMIKRVGGHEAWGAIHAAEIGDGTYECSTMPEAINMLNIMQNDNSIIELMCKQIVTNKLAGIYDGGYKVVKLAAGEKI